VEPVRGVGGVIRHDGATPWMPLFVDLSGRRCCVVGAGPIGTGRVERLLEHGAIVRVVSPEGTERITALVVEGALDGWSRRPFEPDDLDGCLLAVAATDDPEVNRAVAREADRRAVLCSVAAGEPGSATMAAGVRRGPLTIAVGTGGTSPSLARGLRRRLEAEYGPEWGPLAETLGELRHELARCDDRDSAVERVIGSEALALIAAGADRSRVTAVVRRAIEEAA
jgi:precorrin-2 dehydrogenase/sirohydrochlorin ferrochelatase